MTDDERRYAAFSALEVARASGDEVEIGKALTKLSWLARAIGLGDEEQPFFSAVRYGAEAVRVLRGASDKAALSDALRAAAVPFIDGLDHLALLKQSLDVARESGDRSQEAWSLYWLGKMRRDDAMLEEASALFDAIGDLVGQATVRQSQAIRRAAPPREKANQFVQSAEDYLSLGRREEAYKALTMAQVFGSKDLSPKESEALLLRAVELTDAPLHKALTYRNLARIRARIGDPKGERRYLAAEDALDIEAYGSRAKRLEADLEICQEDLAMSSQKERKVLKAKISTLRKELNTLSGG